jgi:fido (protein-threonine AMPylation protein)
MFVGGNPPSWNYSEYPGREIIVGGRTKELLLKMREGAVNLAAYACDSREAHEFLFELMTPFNYGYYAGHYRGENFTGLLNYNVTFGGGRIGLLAQSVPGRMAELSIEIADALDDLDKIHAAQPYVYSDEDKLLETVTFACRILHEITLIHPYADGNGHASRIIAWAILGKYGYWPNKFSIEPRPKEPGYLIGLSYYDLGDPTYLENYILSCM